MGTRDREVAAAALRRDYVHGRLSLEELESRLHMAVGARTAADLHQAAFDLPRPWLDRDDVRQIGRLAKKGATLAALSALWLVASAVLLLGFAVEALLHGASSAGALAFPLVWLVLTLCAWRAGRRA